ncbi:four helix bundle protein [candidate division WOR-3 bacterium]|nr:four helix bundle protein [candidate division WOR-3 bacterium]
MKSFRDLKVLQAASELSRDISTKLVPKFPSEEKFRLGDQIIRSSRSVPAQISEGFRKSSLKEKNHYYEMALTSNDETENHLIEAKNNGYVDDKTYKNYLNRVIRIRILLSRLIKSVNKMHKDEGSKTVHRR